MGGIVMWLIALSVTVGGASLRPAVLAEGCYRFDRPLGHSASGNLERADSTWYSLELREAGAVVRPHLQNAYWRDQYARNSSWRAAGDTLFIRVSTGLVGWDLALALEGGQYVGRARYLTDAIDVGAEPLFVPVRGVREVCQKDRSPPPAPPAARRPPVNSGITG
jgi:hypothetical protein